MMLSSWLKAIAKVHRVHLIHANPHIKPTDLGCESADNYW